MKVAVSKRKGSDGIRGNELAALLKVSRLESGMSGHALAEALGWSQSKVTKTENARTRPTVPDVQAWLGACRVPEEAVQQGRELAESLWIESRHWRNVHADGLSRRQHEVGGMEERSAVIRSFQPAMVPGLLQTAEYARQVLTLANISGQKDIPEAVAARTQRQEVLYRPEQRFEFVLTEAALLWHPEADTVRAAQLDRVLSLSTLTNVSLRVLPLRSHFGQRQNNGFLLFEIPDEPTVIVETLTRELAITDTDEVAQYRHIHDTLTDHALSEEASQAFVRDLAVSL